MAKQRPHKISLKKDDRVLFLTKDLQIIKEQLYQGLQLKMKDVDPSLLLDDINTDIMTPAWVCFHYDPKKIAKQAYAGLMCDGQRVFKDNALIDGKFVGIVSGFRKGTGSSRETAAQCEVFSGIKMVFAASFAPIHKKNNINLGQLMGGYELLMRLQDGEVVDINDFLHHLDPLSKEITLSGGLFSFLKLYNNSTERLEIINKKAMTMAQKIMAKKINAGDIKSLLNHQSVIAKVDGGYSHEFTSAQVHQFLMDEFGNDYKIINPKKFAAFEDHLIYAESLPKNLAFLPLINELRTLQKFFINRNNINDFSAKNGISPGICHEVAKEKLILPGDFIQATDSHTCMGGAINAYAHGVGATEYASILGTGLSLAEVPPSIRFLLKGKLKYNCSAKDVMLYILANFTKNGLTLNSVMEFGGEGLATLGIDERATLCNMATECGAKTGICEPDQVLIDWLLLKHPEISLKEIMLRITYPDKEAVYEKGSFVIDLDKIEPMVAHPGDPEKGIPSDPSNGEYVKNLGEIAIDIAYGGSCTAGKFEDIYMYAKVVKYFLDQGLGINEKVRFFIQYGSTAVEEYAKKNGFHDLFKKAGIKTISPGCGACIGCGPGVSESTKEVTISAINRNFQGRSGPGKLYLASPYTVTASAFQGKIAAFIEK